MLNAVFARLTGRSRASAFTRDEPLRLTSGTTVLALHQTQRRELEIKLAPGVAYPAPGWHTWTVTGDDRATWLLSTFFRQQKLIAVEYYIGKTGREPKYAPRARGRFVLEPDAIGLGSRIDALPRGFRSSPGRAGSVAAVVYQQHLEASWPGGVAIVAANDGKIERIALYGSES